MPKIKRSVQKNSDAVSLRIGASFSDAWDRVLLPWFQNAGIAAFGQEQPVVVLTPLSATAAFLRAKLLDHDCSLIGVKFLTPPHLRELLLQQLTVRVPLREHLRLLLAIAAEQCRRNDESRQISDIIYLAAKSVMRAPDHFLRVLDRLNAGGWNIERETSPALRQIVQKFLQLVRQCEFELIYDADRKALQTISKKAARFSDLLVVGFNGAHWPLWPLLQAAATSSERTTVVLDYPREQARSIDESWVGTWEEHFGAATPISDVAENRARPFVDLSASANPILDQAARAHVQFLVGSNATEQAKAIVGIALNFLQEKSCRRVGIVFPRMGALPRLVSTSLAKLGIPHHDAIRHLAPGQFETRDWNAWLDLQENHQLDPLLRFVASLPDGSELFEGLPIKSVREHLLPVYRRLLIDDLEFLGEYCARQKDNRELTAIAQGLRRIAFLPNTASLADFLAATKPIFAQLDWRDQWNEIERLSDAWSGKLNHEFSRSIYLRWLKEILDSFALARDSAGDHSYSRVHLLSYAEAEGQEWSHLILAGLNQGEWPLAESNSGFLRDERIVDLNKRALRQGKQGEGHWSLREGQTFLLGAQEQRQIASRQFVSAVESTEHALALTASLVHESAPERVWNPSEFFSQIYFRTHGSALSQQTMSILRDETRAWLDEQPFFKRSDRDIADTQTRVAYDARRRVDQPATEYDFALREPIGRTITLRATEWDKAVKHPALIWMKSFLGVENTERNSNEWSVATGDWVHGWLANISDAKGENVFVDLAPCAELRDRVRGAAQRFQNQIVDLCSAAGRNLPDWWLSGWSNALALADCLAGKVGDTSDWPYLSAEWQLESPQIISLGDAAKLRFRGRIDLILARNRPNESELDDTDLWVVDYKTGNNKGLAATSRKATADISSNVRRRLVRGDAVQLGLYALAARELGASKIAVSLLSPRIDLDRPQLDVVDLAAHEDFWNELYRMQETGIFGLVGPIRSDFSFAADYPLATLPIDSEFLKEKWSLTHPALVDDEDER